MGFVLRGGLFPEGLASEKRLCYMLFTGEQDARFSF
jgi:hypothetical protein